MLAVSRPKPSNFPRRNMPLPSHVAVCLFPLRYPSLVLPLLLPINSTFALLFSVIYARSTATNLRKLSHPRDCDLLPC